MVMLSAHETTQQMRTFRVLRFGTADAQSWQTWEALALVSLFYPAKECGDAFDSPYSMAQAGGMNEAYSPPWTSAYKTMVRMINSE